MKHILLVDDVLTNLKCEEFILHNKYKLTMARSGEEALRYLETTLPDLVLLDIYLSKMNGYEVIEQMRKNPKTAEIPVIFLTADGQDNEARGLAMGAADFIKKPVDPQVLLERVEAVWKTEE